MIPDEGNVDENGDGTENVGAGGGGGRGGRGALPNDVDEVRAGVLGDMTGKAGGGAAYCCFN